MFRIRLRAAVAAAALLAAATASAADVAILPVRGTNLTAGEVDAIGVLFAEAYRREAALDVVPPVEVARAIAEAGGVAQAVAKLGVREVVETTAVQLRTRIAIEAVLRDAEGKVLHATKMTAASLDDVQPVAERIARALVHRTTVEAARTIVSVTAREGQPVNRMFTEKLMGLKTSVTWPLARGRSFGPSVGLQFDGRLELAWGFLEFGAGALLPSNSGKDGLGGLFAEFGGSYYLAQSSTSPYVGAGFVPAAYTTETAVGVTAGVYAQAGLMFMRESSTRLYAEFRATQAIVPLEEERYDPATFDYVRTGRIYPTQLALQVGIGW